MPSRALASGPFTAFVNAFIDLRIASDRPRFVSGGASPVYERRVDDRSEAFLPSGAILSVLCLF